MVKFYPLLFALVIFACKTPGKAYHRGDYRDAIELGLKKLQKDPNDAEAADIVKDAYRLAVNRHEARIRSLSASKADNRFAAIYNEYQQLQGLYNLVMQSPAAQKLVEPVNYTEYVETYRNRAGDVHLANAARWEEEGTRQGYREAYQEYRKALRYVSDNPELKKKREKAYYAAQLKVMVLPMQQPYGAYGVSNYNFQMRNLENDVMRTLSFHTGDEFVKFYTEFEMRSRDLEPDQILEFAFVRMTIGRPFEQQSSRTVSKKVVVKEIVYKPDSVVKEYANVTARVTTVQRSLVSEADLLVNVRDPKGRTLWSDRFTGRDRWEDRFVTYSGDERALSESDRAQLNRNAAMPPTEDEVLDRLFRQIQDELRYRMRQFYARF